MHLSDRTSPVVLYTLLGIRGGGNGEKANELSTLPRRTSVTAARSECSVEVTLLDDPYHIASFPHSAGAITRPQRTRFTDGYSTAHLQGDECTDIFVDFGGNDNLRSSDTAIKGGRTALSFSKATTNITANANTPCYVFEHHGNRTLLSADEEASNVLCGPLIALEYAPSTSTQTGGPNQQSIGKNKGKKKDKPIDDFDFDYFAASSCKSNSLSAVASPTSTLLGHAEDRRMSDFRDEIRKEEERIQSILALNHPPFVYDKGPESEKIDPPPRNFFSIMRNHKKVLESLAVVFVCERIHEASLESNAWSTPSRIHVDCPYYISFNPEELSASAGNKSGASAAISRSTADDDQFNKVHETSATATANARPTAAPTPTTSLNHNDHLDGSDTLKNAILTYALPHLEGARKSSWSQHPAACSAGTSTGISNVVVIPSNPAYAVKGSNYKCSTIYIRMPTVVYIGLVVPTKLPETVASLVHEMTATTTMGNRQLYQSSSVAASPSQATLTQNELESAYASTVAGVSSDEALNASIEEAMGRMMGKELQKLLKDLAANPEWMRSGDEDDATQGGGRQKLTGAKITGLGGATTAAAGRDPVFMETDDFDFELDLDKAVVLSQAKGNKNSGANNRKGSGLNLKEKGNTHPSLYTCAPTRRDKVLMFLPFPSDLDPIPLPPLAPVGIGGSAFTPSRSEPPSFNGQTDIPPSIANAYQYKQPPAKPVAPYVGEYLAFMMKLGPELFANICNAASDQLLVKRSQTDDNDDDPTIPFGGRRGGGNISDASLDSNEGDGGALRVRGGVGAANEKGPITKAKVYIGFERGDYCLKEVDKYGRVVRETSSASSPRGGVAEDGDRHMTASSSLGSTAVTMASGGGARNIRDGNEMGSRISTWQRIKERSEASKAAVFERIKAMLIRERNVGPNKFETPLKPVTGTFKNTLGFVPARILSRSSEKVVPSLKSKVEAAVGEDAGCRNRSSSSSSSRRSNSSSEKENETLLAAYERGKVRNARKVQNNQNKNKSLYDSDAEDIDLLEYERYLDDYRSTLQATCDKGEDKPAQQFIAKGPHHARNKLVVTSTKRGRCRSRSKEGAHRKKEKAAGEREVTSNHHDEHSASSAIIDKDCEGKDDANALEPLQPQQPAFLAPRQSLPFLSEGERGPLAMSDKKSNNDYDFITDVRNPHEGTRSPLPAVCLPKVSPLPMVAPFLVDNEFSVGDEKHVNDNTNKATGTTGKAKKKKKEREMATALPKDRASPPHDNDDEDTPLVTLGRALLANMNQDRKANDESLLNLNCAKTSANIKNAATKSNNNNANGKKKPDAESLSARAAKDCVNDDVKGSPPDDVPGPKSKTNPSPVFPCQVGEQFLVTNATPAVRPASLQPPGMPSSPPLNTALVGNNARTSCSDRCVKLPSFTSLGAHAGEQHTAAAGIAVGCISNSGDGGSVTNTPSWWWAPHSKTIRRSERALSNPIDVLVIDVLLPYPSIHALATPSCDKTGNRVANSCSSSFGLGTDYGLASDPQFYSTMCKQWLMTRVPIPFDCHANSNRARNSRGDVDLDDVTNKDEENNGGGVNGGPSVPIHGTYSTSKDHRQQTLHRPSLFATRSEIIAAIIKEMTHNDTQDDDQQGGVLVAGPSCASEPNANRHDSSPPPRPSKPIAFVVRWDPVSLTIERLRLEEAQRQSREKRRIALELKKAKKVELGGQENEKQDLASRDHRKTLLQNVNERKEAKRRQKEEKKLRKRQKRAVKRERKKQKKQAKRELAAQKRAAKRMATMKRNGNADFDQNEEPSSSESSSSSSTSSSSSSSSSSSLSSPHSSTQAENNPTPSSEKFKFDGNLAGEVVWDSDDEDIAFTGFSCLPCPTAELITCLLDELKMELQLGNTIACGARERDLKIFEKCDSGRDEDESYEDNTIEGCEAVTLDPFPGLCTLKFGQERISAENTISIDSVSDADTKTRHCHAITVYENETSLRSKSEEMSSIRSLVLPPIIAIDGSATSLNLGLCRDNAMRAIHKLMRVDIDAINVVALCNQLGTAEECEIFFESAYIELERIQRVGCVSLLMNSADESDKRKAKIGAHELARVIIKAADTAGRKLNRGIHPESLTTAFAKWDAAQLSTDEEVEERNLLWLAHGVPSLSWQRVVRLLKWGRGRDDCSRSLNTPVAAISHSLLQFISCCSRFGFTLPQHPSAFLLMGKSLREAANEEKIKVIQKGTKADSPTIGAKYASWTKNFAKSIWQMVTDGSIVRKNPLPVTSSAFKMADTKRGVPCASGTRQRNLPILPRSTSVVTPPIIHTTKQLGVVPVSVALITSELSSTNAGLPQTICIPLHIFRSKEDRLIIRKALVAVFGKAYISQCANELSARLERLKVGLLRCIRSKRLRRSSEPINGRHEAINNVKLGKSLRSVSDDESSSDDDPVEELNSFEKEPSLPVSLADFDDEDISRLAGCAFSPSVYSTLSQALSVYLEGVLQNTFPLPPADSRGDAKYALVDLNLTPEELEHHREVRNAREMSERSLFAGGDDSLFVEAGKKVQQCGTRYDHLQDIPSPLFTIDSSRTFQLHSNSQIKEASSSSSSLRLTGICHIGLTSRVSVLLRPVPKSLRNRCVNELASEKAFVLTDARRKSTTSRFQFRSKLPRYELFRQLPENIIDGTHALQEEAFLHVNSRTLLSENIPNPNLLSRSTLTLSSATRVLSCVLPAEVSSCDCTQRESLEPEGRWRNAAVSHFGLCRHRIIMLLWYIGLSE